jgi:ABC-type amino acid transport substrate-binding protein
MLMKRLRWMWVAWASLWVLGAGTAFAQTGGDAKPFFIGTSQEAETFLGRWQRRIYPELFRRLGLTVEFRVMPLQRLTIASEQGAVDGEVARIGSYASQHPELVRVDEPVYDMVWALFSIDTGLRLGSLNELAAQPLRVTYQRGIAICEKALKAVVPADRLLDVATDAQGFNMLRVGRSDLHCTGDLTLPTLQYLPELRGVDISHRVLDIGANPLFPLVNKRHADLAPRMAAALRQMKAEGLVERYRADVLREMAAAPAAVTR